MTELAIRQPSTVVDTQAVAVARLSDWAQSAQAAYEVATRLVETSFVPEAFRGKPAEATAAILAGLEVGLSPMSALKAFDVIQGTAAPRAITLRAVAQAAGHQIVLRESTVSRCVIDCKRRGETEWQKVTWTIERARQLGLTGKHNWKAQPDAMLLARATAQAARLVASDAIMGLNGGYAAEEFDDGAPEPTTTVKREPTKRTAKRAQPAPPEAEPEFDEPEAVETVPEDEDLITAAQLTKLHILLKENGIEDRDAGLAYYAKVIGREVESSKALTKAEASEVIESLMAPPFDEEGE